MFKAIRNILVALLILAPGVVSQLFGQHAIKGVNYRMLGFEGISPLTTVKSENLWRFDDLSNGSTISTGNQLERLSLPFYGLVEMNESSEIVALYINEILGSYGPFKAILTQPISLRIPRPETSTTGYTVNLDVNILPQATLNQLPIRPDSLRLRLLATYSDTESSVTKVVLDNQEMDGEFFDRTMNIASMVEVKIGPFEWESVEDIAPMINWNENYQLEQTFVLTDASMLPTAISEVRNNKVAVAMIDLKSRPNNSKVIGMPDIKAIPNPAINDIRFQLTNLKPGKYKISIKNILGVLLEAREIDFDFEQSLVLDVRNFRKGSYFYSLEDENGNVISTKRLIILRP